MKAYEMELQAIKPPNPLKGEQKMRA
jgi:hypothetical protein